jgi:general secretion pathway protein K
MRQRGVALLAVLLVVSIVTVLAVGIAHSNMVRLGLTEHRMEAAQAWQIWQGGVEWSRDILRQDALRSTYDYPGEFWGRGLRDYPAEGGKLTGVMIDQQGLFNLNNLVRNGQDSAPDRAVFQRLLARLGLSPSLSDAVVDWIDSDSVALPNGAEDPVYMAMQPPYRAADRPMSSLAELYWIKGFDAATVARLRPYVTVLPRNTAVNVNSAPKELLAAMLPDLDDGQVASLWSRLRAEPCANLDAFARLLPANAHFDAMIMATSSQFFLLELRVVYGGTRAEGQALLDRSSGLPRVVWRERGLGRALDLTNPVQQNEWIGKV